LSTPFQNRLVGTVIVAAVAIIFLPDLLDGNKKTYQNEFAKIPQAPNIDFKSKASSFPSEKLAKLSKESLSDDVALDDNQQTKEAGDIANGKTKEEGNTLQPEVVEKDTVRINTLTKPEEIKTAETPITKQPSVLPEKAIANTAWVIQLGSFRHKNNVDELVKNLTKAGYTAFTKPIKTKTGTLTKVFVGPELTRSSLEKKVPALKKLTNVEGKIAKYSPTK